MVAGRILVIDDEETLLEACEETLSYHDYAVELQSRAEDGVAAVRRQAFDLVLIDLKMPGMDGLEVLGPIRAIDVQQVAIVMTAFPEISTAVQAVREGAFDYLPKPFEPDQLLIAVERALRQKQLIAENADLRQALGRRSGLDDIVAHSAKMRQVVELVEKVADQDCSVLIEGPLPARTRAKRVCWKWLRAERSSSTRSRPWGLIYRPNCCEYCRSARCAGWAVRS